MRNTGKELEGLVALIEKFHLPSGFHVTTNERVYNAQHIQTAEFDIQVKGRLGTTDLAWLIECRDRPSDGSAPREWIEQLIGRRTASGFNKVTAVSTTGFSAGALELAEQQGIEVREVRSLTAEHFAEWLKVQTLPYFQQLRRLCHATFYTPPDEQEERSQALKEILAQLRTDQPILRTVRTNQLVTVNTAFQAELVSRPELFEEVVPNGRARLLKMRVIYPDDIDYFTVDTKHGPVRISEIVFEGELEVTRTEIPLQRSLEYVLADSGEVISQTAAFIFDALDRKLSLEMHKLTKSGETQLVLRNLGDSAKRS